MPDLKEFFVMVSCKVNSFADSEEVEKFFTEQIEKLGGYNIEVLAKEDLLKRVKIPEYQEGNR